MKIPKFRCFFFFFPMCLWFHSFLMEFSMNLHFLYWCVPYSVSLLYSCYFLLFLERKTTRMISSTHINWSYSIQVIQNIYVFLLYFSVLHSHCQYWRMEKKLMSCKMTYKLIMEETSFQREPCEKQMCVIHTLFLSNSWGF